MLQKEKASGQWALRFPSIFQRLRDLFLDVFTTNRSGKTVAERSEIGIGGLASFEELIQSCFVGLFLLGSLLLIDLFLRNTE